MSKNPLPRSRTLTAAEIQDFSHVRDHLLDNVRLLRTNLIPPAAAGMTIGKFVLLRDDHIMRTSSTLLAHELVHVRQFAEMGAPRFLFTYLSEYVRNLWRCRNHHQAYLDISLEVEARAVANQWRTDLAKDTGTPE